MDLYVPLRWSRSLFYHKCKPVISASGKLAIDILSVTLQTFHLASLAPARFVSVGTLLFLAYIQNENRSNIVAKPISMQLIIALIAVMAALTAAAPIANPSGKLLTD